MSYRTSNSLPTARHLPPPISDFNLADKVQKAREHIEEQRAALAAEVETEVHVISDPDIAKAIVRFATKHEVDLIALSTHGHKGWRRYALGSVVRISPIPVLSFHRTRESAHDKWDSVAEQVRG